MKRHIISHAEAKEILTPHYERIARAVLEGFDDYLKLTKYSTDVIGFVEYENRTKACIIHDNIKNRIKEAFQWVDGTETGKWNGVFGLKINDDLFIRFNKINPDYSTSGYMTEQAKAYRKQLTIEGLPDGPTFLFAGYTPDDSWTQAKAIHIACWDGYNLQWVEDIINHTASIQTTIHFPNIEDETPRRVKTKISDKAPDTKTSLNE